MIDESGDHYSLKTSFKDTHNVTVLNPQTSIFQVEDVILAEDFNSTFLGILETIRQDLLQDNHKPFCLFQWFDPNRVGSVSNLLDKEKSIFFDHFLDQIFQIFLLQNEVVMETFQA